MPLNYLMKELLLVERGISDAVALVGGRGGLLELFPVILQHLSELHGAELLFPPLGAVLLVDVRPLLLCHSLLEVILLVLFLRCGVGHLSNRDLAKIDGLARIRLKEARGRLAVTTSAVRLNDLVIAIASATVLEVLAHVDLDPVASLESNAARSYYLIKQFLVGGLGLHLPSCLKQIVHIREKGERVLVFP